MKKIMTVLVLLAVVLIAIATYTKSANGPYYSHSAYRGMPNRMTCMTSDVGDRLAKGNSGETESLGVIAIKYE